jgi:hypothetical protein
MFTFHRKFLAFPEQNPQKSYAAAAHLPASNCFNQLKKKEKRERERERENLIK